MTKTTLTIANREQAHKEDNTFTILRKYKGRTLTISAIYSETTDDWNVVLIEDKKPIEARHTSDVLMEAADMLNLAFA